MSAGTGKIKQVAAFRGAPSGLAGLPPQGSDPSSIDLDLVNGVKDTRDTVGGVDTTYAKPPSTFFSGAAGEHLQKKKVEGGLTSVASTATEQTVNFFRAWLFEQDAIICIIRCAVAMSEVWCSASKDYSVVMSSSAAACKVGGSVSDMLE